MSTATTPESAAAFSISDFADSLSVTEITAAARVHKNTVRAWQNEGSRGWDGRLHRLPFVLLGKRRYVRKADLASFIEAINARP